MSEHNRGNLMIRFVDGRAERFEYARVPQNDVSFVSRIQEALNVQDLLVEVG